MVKKKKRCNKGSGLVLSGAGLRLAGSGLRLAGSGLRLAGAGKRKKKKRKRGKSTNKWILFLKPYLNRAKIKAKLDGAKSMADYRPYFTSAMREASGDYKK